MNYLAHLYLSQDNGLSKAGNLMADFLKHVDLVEQPQAILQGIKNHQATDKFTDSHPVILALKAEFDPSFRRYVPIILDVTYDHMLAKSWGQYHDQDLHAFTAHCYGQLASAEQYMPDIMKSRLREITKNDWLASYVGLEAVERTLIAISNRMRFDNHLDKGYGEVLQVYHLIEESFHVFFPELCKHIKAQEIEVKQ
jgi:acyl carrier protein phosphodiesterase